MYLGIRGERIRYCVVDGTVLREALGYGGCLPQRIRYLGIGQEGERQAKMPWQLGRRFRVYQRKLSEIDRQVTDDAKSIVQYELMSKFENTTSRTRSTDLAGWFA